MERENLEFILEKKHYLKGGTKEACIKAREFINHSINPGNQLHSPLSCVKADEFLKAVNILIAFAFSQDDTIPETWKCDNDCLKTSYFLCPGEFGIEKDSEKRCPFFVDESLI